MTSIGGVGVHGGWAVLRETAPTRAVRKLATSRRSPSPWRLMRWCFDSFRPWLVRHCV